MGKASWKPQDQTPRKAPWLPLQAKAVLHGLHQLFICRCCCSYAAPSKQVLMALASFENAKADFLASSYSSSLPKRTFFSTGKPQMNLSHKGSEHPKKHGLDVSWGLYKLGTQVCSIYDATLLAHSSIGSYT
eukprot:1158896-Pelagomonas_calceolata.AAC.6